MRMDNGRGPGLAIGRHVGGLAVAYIVKRMDVNRIYQPWDMEMK